MLTAEAGPPIRYSREQPRIVVRGRSLGLEIQRRHTFPGRVLESLAQKREEVRWSQHRLDEVHL